MQTGGHRGRGGDRRSTTVAPFSEHSAFSTGKRKDAKRQTRKQARKIPDTGPYGEEVEVVRVIESNVDGERQNARREWRRAPGSRRGSPRC